MTGTSADPGAELDHLRGWIGREESDTEILSPQLARQYHMTFDRPGAPPEVGDAVPRLMHWCLAQPVAPMSRLGPDGHAALGDFHPPVPLPRRMWAGGEVTFHGDLRVGDVVRRRSRIADVTLKQGRTGPLYFVTVAHEISVDGAARVSERQDLVYREEGGSGDKTLPPAERGAERREVTPSTTLLFRYSAMTFNGHRIHYDRDHAVATEGYDGLVVHGPLQAAMMLLFAQDLTGRAPDRFRFRGASPLTDTAPFAVHAAAEAEGTMPLWTARDGGPVAMQAEAGWS